MPNERPASPPEIVTISPDGEEFSVDLNGMEIDRMYQFEYQGDGYAIKKRPSGALVMYEIVTVRDWPRLALMTLVCVLRRRQRPRVVRFRCGE